MEDDGSLAIEMASINDNVDYMEDRLTSQAIAAEESRKRDKKPRWQSSAYGGRFRKLTSRSSKSMDTLMKVIKAEIMEQNDGAGTDGGLDSEDDAEMEPTNLSDDILGLNIKEDEVRFRQ